MPWHPAGAMLRPMTIRTWRDWARWPRHKVLTYAWRWGAYLPPDRRVLERTILPALAQDPRCRRVLFVGVKRYNAHYGRLFPERAFVTIDPDPAVAQFGGHPHVVDRVQNLHAHFSAKSFDLIVMSGVIGFGLDDAVEVDRALSACHWALRSEGTLVVGLNELKATHVDPDSVPARDGFVPHVFAPLGTSRHVVAVPFEERTHTFLFWRKR